VQFSSPELARCETGGIRIRELQTLLS